MATEDARPASSLRQRFWAAVRHLKLQLATLWHASADARTPRAAKLLAALVLGMALSPIDLIPDFIPVLGYVDDALLVPLGVWCAMRLIPDDVWQDARARAAAGGKGGLPPCNAAAAAVCLLWGAALARGCTAVWGRWVAAR